MPRDLHADAAAEAFAAEATATNGSRILQDLRMLLKTIPLRDAALLRVLFAARLEADNRTGEIFGNNPAERLREASGITRWPTFDLAMAQAKQQG
jgi:hypothetical protein